MYTSSELRSHGDLHIVLKVLFISVLIQGVIAIGQHLTENTLGLEFFGAYDDPGLKAQTWRGLAERTRVGGTMGHPNALALFFDLLIPLGFSLVFGPLQWGTRFLLVSAVGSGILGLVFTLSRGGLVATGLGCLLIFFVWLKQRIGLLRAFCATMLPTLLIVVFVFGTSNLVSKRFFRDDYKAAFGRIPLILVALNMIQRRPFFGVGLNNYSEVAPRYDNTPHRITSWWNVPVHNQFLFIVAETGLVGLGCYLLFILAILRSVWSAIRSSDPLLAWTGLGLAVGIAVFLAHLQIEFDSMARNSLFWFVSGLAVSVGRLAEMSSKDTGAPVNMHGQPIAHRYLSSNS
jgi:O-antigen ligase